MSLPEIVFLYGPSGTGKSSLGKRLAQNLDLPFYDLDKAVESVSGMTIPQIFAREGEASFRQREFVELKRLVEAVKGVIALGGGALTFPESRQLAESNGVILLLTAPYEILLDRLQKAQAEQEPFEERPLLSGDLEEKLQGLLARRKEHYASFPLTLDTGSSNFEEAAWQAQVQLGWHRLRGMGEAYDIRAAPGALRSLGAALSTRGLRGPLALVSDANVVALYGKQALSSLAEAGYEVQTLVIPAGEAHKTLQTVQELWSGFLSAGLERGSTVVALGGGVVGDLAGFAAATYLRGVRWVNVPTTLLAMVDSSLGGKTGADLPQGKNLIGAFHPPALVLADADLLLSLPQAELRSGMAEVIKHGILGDPELFAQTSRGIPNDLAGMVQRGMAVKVRLIEIDPYEKGLRAALNLGHTLGHAVELVSNFELRHGEAVAIGLVAEARLAEKLGIAAHGLAETIASALENSGLPTRIPAGMDRQAVIRAMGMDKKRAGGKIRLALPVRIGEAVTGVEVSDFGWLEAV
jgi:shikimate kinase / 3-dehydroquinate synthase